MVHLPFVISMILSIDQSSFFVSKLLVFGVFWFASIFLLRPDKSCTTVSPADLMMDRRVAYEIDWLPGPEKEEGAKNKPLSAANSPSASN